MSTVIHVRAEDLDSGDSAHATCSCHWVSPFPASREDLGEQFLAHQADGTVPEFVDPTTLTPANVSPVIPMPAPEGSELPGPVV